jgi:hypothetical protein
MFDRPYSYPDRICELWETMRDMDLSKKLLLSLVDDLEDFELIWLSCSLAFLVGLSWGYSLEVWIDF